MDTLQNMRVFERVVEAGSFTAVANSLHMTVGSISRAVSELESHLRTRLLNRSTRRFSLTPAGEQYLRDCRQILADIDRAEELARGAHEYPAGKLRVFSFASIGQHYVLPAVSTYRTQFTEVTVEVTLSQSTPDLFSGGGDVAVVVAPSLPDSDMISHLLASTYSILCASPHYVRSFGAPQRPTDLVNHACLTLNTPAFPTNEWLLEGPLGSEQIQVKGPLQVNIAEALTVAIREGLGIGVVPLHAAVEGLRDGTLIRVLPEHTLLKMKIYAIYASRKFVDAKTRTWVDHLRTRLPEFVAHDKVMLARLTAVPQAEDTPLPVGPHGLQHTGREGQSNPLHNQRGRT
jgi:DNA-binding transcriptional LysR family regulator